MVHDCQLCTPVCQGREVMTPCISPLWTKTGVHQKLLANGLHISLVTHEFLDQVKVQRFCLTLVGEARLWYESLRLINTDWVGLQNIFRQQYSKIGNTRDNYLTCRDHFISMKHGNNGHLHESHKACSDSLRVSRATNIRSL